MDDCTIEGLSSWHVSPAVEISRCWLTENIPKTGFPVTCLPRSDRVNLPKYDFSGKTTSGQPVTRPESGGLVFLGGGESKGLRFLPQFADSSPGEYAGGHARGVHPHFFRAFEFSRRR